MFAASKFVQLRLIYSFYHLKIVTFWLLFYSSGCKTANFNRVKNIFILADTSLIGPNFEEVIIRCYYKEIYNLINVFTKLLDCWIVTDNSNKPILDLLYRASVPTLIFMA